VSPSQAKVGALYLPFANPRHAHEFKVFESQPLAENRALVAGVIDTVANYIEHRGGGRQARAHCRGWR